MEAIGQALKAARVKAQMSAGEVANAMKITSTVVQAMERGDFSVFPAPFYAKGFIKSYAACVGIDPAPLLRRFDALAAAPEKRRSPAKPKGREVEARLKPPRSFQWPKIDLSILSRIQLPRFKLPDISLSRIRLPVKTWKLIFAGLGLVVVVPLLWLLLRSAGTGSVPYLSPACKHVQEPPPPYLDAVMQGQN